MARPPGPPAGADQEIKMAPSTRRALVTGGSRGIGREIALALAVDGCAVVTTARTESGLAETARLGAAAGHTIGTLACDVGDLDAVEQLVGRASDLWGGEGPTVVVNCAGVVRPGKISAISREDFGESMRVNVQAALVVVQQALPAMRAAGWGRIVNIGSMYSRIGPKYAGSYAISKHAVLGLTRVMSSELSRYGITANAVLPGWTNTAMLHDEARVVAGLRGIEEAAAIRLFLRNQPMERVIEPREVAGLVTFLCGDAAAAISGQSLGIDGGELQP
jgi:NAD(P)-dependent dehydrogenase (short-subunit alcohol dehydrogenase family)